MTAKDPGGMRHTSIDRSTGLTKTLLLCGVLAGPLFVAVFLVEGATRPGYDPMRLPVSLLSTGGDGWTQAANFIVDGFLLLAFAFGLHRALGQRGTPSMLGPLLLAVVALAVLAAGVFSTDPGGGYPPGVHPPRESSLHGVLHDAISAVVFTMLPVACFVFARRFGGWGERRWATYSAVTGTALAIGFVLILVGFNGSTPVNDVAGLIQRAWIVVAWGWIALLAVHMLRTPRS
jgi:hypothetical protein